MVQVLDVRIQSSNVAETHLRHADLAWHVRQERDVPSVTQYMEAISVHLLLRRPELAQPVLLPVLSSYDARCSPCATLVLGPSAWHTPTFIPSPYLHHPK